MISKVTCECGGVVEAARVGQYREIVRAICSDCGSHVEMQSSILQDGTVLQMQSLDSLDQDDLRKALIRLYRMPMADADRQLIKSVLKSARSLRARVDNLEAQLVLEEAARREAEHNEREQRDIAASLRSCLDVQVGRTDSWCWIPGDDNDLASLSDTCVVLICAKDLRSDFTEHKTVTVTVNTKIVPSRMDDFAERFLAACEKRG